MWIRGPHLNRSKVVIQLLIITHWWMPDQLVWRPVTASTWLRNLSRSHSNYSFFLRLRLVTKRCSLLLLFSSNKTVILSGESIQRVEADPGRPQWVGLHFANLHCLHHKQQIAEVTLLSKCYYWCYYYYYYYKQRDLSELLCYVVK